MAVFAPEDIVNQALAAIGYPERISHLNDGSRPARAAIEVYSQTRDAMLRTGDWPFARRTLPLTLIKGPPPPGGYSPAQPWTTAYPPPGWLYEYAFPTDCLLVGAILRAPGAMFDLNPQPAVWRIDRDTTLATPAKVILCNTRSAIAVYTAQAIDPTQWEPAFIEALVKAIAAKLAPVLARTPGAERENLLEAGAAMASDSRSG